MATTTTTTTGRSPARKPRTPAASASPRPRIDAVMQRVAELEQQVALLKEETRRWQEQAQAPASPPASGHRLGIGIDAILPVIAVVIVLMVILAWVG